MTRDLLLLFLVLPVVVGVAVMALVAWRADPVPAEGRTSTILASGQPARGEIVAVRALGGFLDARPMVVFDLRIETPGDSGGETVIELRVVQPVPRRSVRDLHPGMTVDVRLSADRSRGAVVL